LEFLEGGEPFILENPSAPAAVVCVHGLNATPFEVRPVGEGLFQAGFHVEGPLIAGHGIAPVEEGIRQFHASTRDQWLESIRSVVVRLKETFPRVYMMGQSLGGVITFHLASEGLVDAIATTGVALHLPHPADWFHVFIKHMNTIVHTKPKQAFRNVNYGILSSRAGNQLYELAVETRARVPLIHCPVLVIHSRKDNVQPITTTKFLQKTLKSPLEIAWFNNGGHTMPLDVDGPAVVQKIVDFFTRQLSLT
jgi:carboxylesterase